MSDQPANIVATPRNPRKAKNLNFQITGRNTREHRTWFRGEHTHANPIAAQMFATDATDKYVLKGWKPDAPMITPNTQITAFGSCFAANISNWLAKRNYNVLTKGEDAKSAYVVACGEGMVNSFVIRQQFEWAWENKQFEGSLWTGYDKKDYGYDPKIQTQTKAIFDSTDFFILTFGLSEVWYDEPTGNVFWRTIPKDAYDPERHKFRVSTVEENRDNLRAIYKLIRKHRPDAKILFTLSPIPLIATFRNNSCITSNAVSKAVLRVAIDEVVREFQHEKVLGYWPSYELVTEIFQLPYKADRRHPVIPVLDYIMTLFEHTWCTGSSVPPPNLTLAWADALCAAKLLPEDLTSAVETRKLRRIRQALAAKVVYIDEASNKAIRELMEHVMNAIRDGWPATDVTEHLDENID